MLVSNIMKENFIFDRNKNEYYHNTFPSIRFDMDTFNQMDDYDLDMFLNSKMEELNKEISTSKPKRINNPQMSIEDALKELDKIRNNINQESFSSFFMRKIHSSR